MSKLYLVPAMVKLKPSVMVFIFFTFICPFKGFSQTINHLVISQIYGGGGNSGATYTNDFIEIFNPTGTPVDLTGYSVQYSSAGSTSGAFSVTPLSGTIGSGKYYLIQEASNAAVGQSLPTPDVTGTITLSATTGKVALTNSTTALTASSSGCAVSSSSVIDFVGFGSANCFEGTGPASAPSATNSIFRKSSGCTDTDDNASDFTTGMANARNSSTAAHFCTAPPVLPQRGEILINQFSPQYSSNTDDEYIELVNTTNKTFDLSTLSIFYKSGTGGAVKSILSPLNGTLQPYSFWLIADTTTVIVGGSNITSDAVLNPNMATTTGQIGVVLSSDSTMVIDGVGYGSVTAGNYYETSPASGPTSNGGLKRVTDGLDNNNNSTDFARVANGSIYLRNSTSRLANSGATIAAGTYTDLSVTGNSSLAGLVSLTNLLTVQNGGTLTTNNNLTLKSTNSQTARIGTITSGAITGNVTVERFIPASGRKFRLLSPETTGSQTIRQAWQENGAVVNNLGTWITSNVTNAVSNGFDDVSQNPSILVWDSTASSTNSWYDRLVTNTNAKPLSSEPGYMLFVRGDRTATPANSVNNVTTLRSTGSLRVGPQTTTVVGTASSGERYTLVGNPYASPIDFEQVFTNASTTNIKSQFWIWDARRSGLGGYTLIRRTGANSYDAVPSPFGGTADSTTATLQHIQSGQAFFVEPATITNGQVYIEENDKSAITYNSIFKTSSGANPTLRINLSQQNADNTELTDGVMAAFSADYTPGIDADDVAKMNNFNENISLKRGSKNLTVESRPLIATQDTLFLNITNTTQRDYQLAFKADNFNSSGVLAFLEDRFLKTKTPVSMSDITKVTFSVTPDPASSDASRFSVVFQANSILAVNFTTIKASRKDQDIQVQWNVATENNIDHYEVQKSIDGRQFARAVSINATRANGFATYSWMDAGAGNSDNYYRVKAISNSGSAILSAIVKVNSLKGKGSILVYPNPVFNRNLSLQFNGEPAGKYTIQVFNGNGQQVFSKSIEHQEGSSTETLQLGNNVTKGVYQLKISNGENTITQKIICN